MSAHTQAPIDVEVLRGEIQKTYTEVSTKPEQEFIFPTGRPWAEALAYPAELLEAIPAANVGAFAGVANPWVHGAAMPGERVLDLGCGGGTDALVAAQMVGPSGHVTGIDMTPAMLALARAGAAEMGLQNVELIEAMVEAPPLADACVDLVISNGVIDLLPDKDAVFEEIVRVLRPGGRLQIADVVIHHEVSEDARKNIDLWTG